MRSYVTAVVVSHDGERWLPVLLRALDSQQRQPDRVVAVDTGSSDGSLSLLQSGLGQAAVVAAPRTLGYGAAVRHGVAAAEQLRQRPAELSVDQEWIWLLHDDCAPAPDALQALLTAAEREPDAAVLGAKVRAWPDSRELLDVGVAITGTGRRETGLEPGELDQGQHDTVRPVLAADSADMLVRRDVWEQLAGFDPELALFRDDVDFGWRAARAGHRVLVCPQAVVYHAEAAARGLRRIDNASRRPHRADRRGALHTVLVNCRALAFPVVVVRLVTGSLLRSLGYVLGKAPGLAADELAAVSSVLSRPRRLLRARRARRRTALLPPGAVRPLLPPWWLPYRRGLDAAAHRLFAGRSPARPTHARGRPVVESGPVAEEAEELPAEPGALLRALRQPFVLALVMALTSALIAARGLLGAGMLQGGALLPAPGGASDLWRAYLSAWHPVGLGSDAIAPPYLGLLAVFATVFGGKAWLAVDALFLLAVPLATTTAYLASSRWIRSRAVRAWMAVAYGLLPVLTGAVAQGRLGTVAATILAPLAARSAALVFIAKRRRQDSTDPRWPAAFATGLWLAALMALVPMSYPIAVAAIACTGVALVRSLGGLARVLTAVSIPPLLLLPWSLALATEPAHWFAEAGRQDPVGAGVAAQGLQLALGRPGGPGAAPAWIGAGILAAAFVALLRRDRRAAALAAWVVGLAGLVVATVQSGAVAELPQFYDGFVAWPGFAVVVVQGAALVAAAAAADGAIAALAGGGFGWRQPTAALVALAAGAAPFLGLTWWVVEGYDGPLRRGAPVALPAYLVEAQVSPTRERTLVIDTADQRPVTYQLVRDDGPRTGDEALAPPLRQSLGLDRIVAKLVSDPNARDVHALADYAVANVVLSAPADRQVASRLDSLAVLTRASAGAEQAAAWRLTASTGRVRLLPTNSVPGAGEVLPSAESTAAATIRPGSRPRRLALAENLDASWRATLNGQVLRRQDSADWGQRFAVGREGGPLRIGYDSGNRRWWLLAQLGMVVVALVLAAPGIRRASSGAQA